MTAPSYSIIAATCHGNRGAQAMLETVVGRLTRERQDLHFHVFSYYPVADRALVEDQRISVHSSTPLALVGWLLPWSLLFGLARLLFGKRVFRWAPASIRALGQSAALVDLAGVSFIDGREKFLPFNVLTVMPAWLLGTPVAKMSQAMGPFDGRLNRLVSRLVLPMCAMLWARGPRTLQHLQEAGFPGVRFVQADDIAFNHDSSYSLTDEGGELLATKIASVERLRGDVRGIVGLCPSSVVAVKARKEGGGYEPAMVQLIEALAQRGFAVVLFPNATRDAAGEAERNNDLPLMRRLSAAVTASGKVPTPLMFDMDINASAIKRIIGMMDVVVVSRFHAMVGALSLAVPPAVLGWSHKYAEVMARFGLEANVLDYKQLAGADLAARTERLFEERGLVAAQIRQHLPAVKESADCPVISLLSPTLGADFA